MNPDPSTGEPVPPPQTLATLLQLARQARHAASPEELGFLAVNDTHALVPYRQAALWSSDGKILSLSGVVQPEANAPYVQWLDAVCRALARQASDLQAQAVGAESLPPDLAQDWNEWLPAHGLWLPFARSRGDAGPALSAAGPTCGLLLARETPWLPGEVTVLAEWLDLWRHAWCAMTRRGPWFWPRASARSRQPAPGRRAATRLAAGLGLAAVLCFPVRLTVLVPGELVPAHPAVIRAPQDGVVGSFFVKPNAMVTPGQALFDLDGTALTSRLEVARQALASAEAEFRQSAQLAVSDGKYKGQLALLTGKVEERRADVDYLQGQLERSHVVAPQGGMVLFDDPSEWVGKPVATGERIMRVAVPHEVEIEAWLPVGDAIPMDNGAAVTLYLNASPLAPVAAQIRYLSHDALQRPDGNYAYRVRATLLEATSHRIGLKGTAKLTGDRAALGYWILRKPLAAVRQWIGH